MTTLYTEIGELVTNDPSVGDETALGLLRDAAILVDDDRIVWVGASRTAPAADRRFDCGGAAVIPGFVDSHAHLVFAGDRSAEFAARMSGEPYDGGGIAITVTATRAASDAALGANLARLAGELRDGGVTTFEAKSGYGLTVPDEQRSLQVAAHIHRRDHLPRRPRGAARVPHRPRRLHRPRRRRRCSPRAPRTPAGSTCSATAAPSTSTKPETSSRPASPPG